MYKMDTGERIVDVRALLSLLLAGWRGLLVCGLVFSVLGAGFQGLRLLPRLRSSQQASVQEAAGEPLETDPVSLVEENLRRKQEYLNKSVLVKIDPGSEGRAYIYFDVFTEEMGRSQAEEEPIVVISEEQEGSEGTEVANASYMRAAKILNYYIRQLIYSTDYSALSEEMGVEVPYLMELVSVTVSDPATETGCIRTIYTDVEGARKLAEYLYARLEALQPEAEKEYGEHSLKISGIQAATVTDRAYNTFLKDRLQEINDLSTQRDNYYKNMGTNSGRQTAASGLRIRGLLKSCLKYAAAGFIGGVFLFALMKALYLIASGTVLSGGELSRQFGLEKLGELTGGETAYRIADMKIKNSAGAVSSVAVTGDIPESRLKEICSGLQSAEEGSAVTYTALTDIGSRPDMLKALSECGAVVVAVQPAKSKYRKIGELLETAHSYGKKTVGSIVVR